MALATWIADHWNQIVVKFDTDQLPPILNALTTENAGQKLVLEVAVSEQIVIDIDSLALIFKSNIWAKMSFAPSLWTVPRDLSEAALP